MHLNPAMRISFFPYCQEDKVEQYRAALLSSDVVIVYFPMLLSDLVGELRCAGVKVLAYVSVYKAPVIAELEYGTGFQGGSPSREEVERNPFWLALSRRSHFVMDQQGLVKRPFNKLYKKGWYQLCIWNAACRESALSGLNALLQSGLDGVFVDNVVPHDRCFALHCPGCGMHPDTIQFALLRDLYGLVKSVHDEYLVFLNVGRRYLYQPLCPADVYVIENFCYGEHTNVNQLYFASRYCRGVEQLMVELNRVQSQAFEHGVQLLGYTKITRSLTPMVKRICLEKSLAIAQRCGMLWSTPLSNESLISKHELYF